MAASFGDPNLAIDGMEMPTMSINSSLASRLLRTNDAASLLGLSGRNLEKHRTYGTGPVYRKIGGRVAYAIDDLQAWADSGRRRSASDSGTHATQRAAH
jgi:predicted DNA-binding transcriptional regulator AlpA